MIRLDSKILKSRIEKALLKAEMPYSIRSKKNLLIIFLKNDKHLWRFPICLFEALSPFLNHHDQTMLIKEANFSLQNPIGIGTQPGTLTGTLPGTHPEHARNTPGTPQKIFGIRHIKGDKYWIFIINMIPLIEKGSEASLSLLIQKALSFLLLYDLEFISLRDIIFLFQEQESIKISWRLASQICEILERWGILFLNGKRCIYGREIHKESLLKISERLAL